MQGIPKHDKKAAVIVRGKIRVRKEIIENQNKDLRVRLQNQAGKFELKANQYEEEIKALKKENGTIKMLQGYIAECEAEIDALKKENTGLKEENIKLAEINEKQGYVIDQLKARAGKDSSTSDKPPSTNVFVKVKPCSLREKSGQKVGGQPGHVGHGPKLSDVPTVIIEKKPCTCGNCGRSVDVKADMGYARRQVVDFDIVLNITEERVFSGTCPSCGKIETAVFSEAFKGPVQYGVNMKSFITLLNSYGCVPDSKTAEIINSISEGVINMSTGTVVNIRRDLSEKLTGIINFIREELILAKVLCGDESGLRVNGKLKWGQVFCDSNFALYSLNSKRGDIDGGIGILAYFTGILVHDHFMSYYKYKTMTHAECNQHILRYLKGLVEIFKHAWFSEMSDLLKTMCHEKNELIRAGKPEMSAEDIDAFSKKYDEILERGWLQYQAATQGNDKKEKYHNPERCLLTRLGEYKYEHLLFLENFSVPFSNNNSEQGIRVLKTKTKVSGCFRHDEGADWYLRIMSLITSLRKQKLPVFDGIRLSFLGQSPFFQP
jgi:transposase